MTSRLIQTLDTTLRDGAQGEGVSFSVSDKLQIVRTLDAFGVGYIEAGMPGSNPKDAEFFHKAAALPLRNARLCAFGRTARPGVLPQEDAEIAALLAASTPAVAIFGKACAAQVTQVLGISLAENLTLVRESVAYLCAQGRELFFDAEHFFDGYAQNADYALAVLREAADAGAAALVLCDTNGAALPQTVGKVTAAVCAAFPNIAVAIHCHNDMGCATANSLLAAAAGASQVQGTLTGLGERCGNADLSQILPALQLKCGYETAVQMEQLSAVCRKIAEITNTRIERSRPYIGASAFAHKGGMHIDAMRKQEGSFEHIAPESVGNRRRFLISEVTGRSGVLQKLRSLYPLLEKDSDQTAQILTRLKELEHSGYQFEAADASFELMVRRTLGDFTPHFDLVLYKTIGEYPVSPGAAPASATIQLAVDGQSETTAALGSGPVNALDLALRKALTVFYPEIGQIRLTDYKVRVLDQDSATAAKVRVLIETRDASSSWVTIGVSDDIIRASLLALVDSMEYKLHMK